MYWHEIHGNELYDKEFSRGELPDILCELLSCFLSCMIIIEKYKRTKISQILQVHLMYL